MENREVALSCAKRRNTGIDGAMIGRFRSYERAAELLDSLPESMIRTRRDRK